MTWYTFGGRPDAVLTDTAGNVVPNWPLTVKVAGTGAVVSALFEADHTTPIAQLKSNASGTFPPGAIRTFAIEDVRAITYQYLDASSNPVTWYEEAREVATSALDAATSAGSTAAAAGSAASAAQAAADAAQASADEALSRSGIAGWYVVTGAAADGVTDDSAIIQSALDAAHTAGGGTVLIPPGNYAVATALAAFSYTVVYAYGATLKATGNNGLLHNYPNLTDAPTAYTGPSHITVLGGVWDGNAGTGSGQTSGEHDVISFNHCSDITCRDMVVRNTSTAHALEFNSTDGGRAIDCRFEGFADLSVGSARQFSEAVQIDIAVSGSSAIGAFDNTPSKNIQIIGCYCGPSSTLGAFGRFVGSHTVASGVYYDTIEIRGNRVNGTIQEGIHGYGWRRVVIADNVITGTGLSSISLTVPDPASAGYALNPDQITISGNTVDGMAAESGIRVLGFATAQHSGVRITGNTVNGEGTGSANGIHVEYCVGPGVVGNTVEKMPSAGVFVNHCTDAVVSGCTAISCGTNALNATSSPGAVIAGNIVDTTSANYGIFLLSSDSCSVTGNRVTAAASAGIRLSTSATNATVVANQVRKGSGTTAAGITLDATATGALLLDNDLSGNGWSASTALGVSTAAPTTGAGGMTALPGSNTVDGDLTAFPSLEAAMRPAGRFETTSRLRCGTSSAPTSGTLYLVPVWLPKAAVISNLSFVSVIAITSPTHWWFTLHDSSRVALARTADQTTTAWGASTTKTLAIAQTTAGTASSYTTTYTGLHYLGVMYTGSALTLMSEGSLSQGADSAPAFGASSTGQTTPPTVTSGAFTATAPSGAAIPAYAYTT